MKNKKLIFSLILFFLVLGISTISNAGSLEYKSLNFDAKLNDDGSMNVIETWNIDVGYTNTLFKTFAIDESKYAGIKDVKVAEITKSGSTKNYDQVYEEMYHVPTGSYYGLINSSNKFEIAWGTGMEDESSEIKKYVISYTVVDAVKTYNDCSVLYWQFLGKDSEIPADKVTGTIKLPKEVQNLDDLRAWAHGPLNGNIERTNNGLVSFDVKDLSSGTMVEVRLAVKDKSLFTSNLNKVNKNELDDILAEETKWADEANRKRKMLKMVGPILAVIDIIICIFGSMYFLMKTKKYKEELQSVKKIVPETKYDYFREIPDETATPFEMGILLTNGYPINDDQAGKFISATFLNMTLKGVLKLDVMPNDKKNVKIKIISENYDKLSEDEKLLLEILIKAKNKYAKSEDEFTIKDFEKYIKAKASEMITLVKKMDKKAVESEIKKEKYSLDNKAKSELNGAKFVGYFVGLFICFIFPLIEIVFLINTVLTYKLMKRYGCLTQKGINEREQWIGLKKYMKDFSLLKEREVPELVLWEKYLVYATAFGIAEQVLKQLKVVYADVYSNSDYYYSHNSAYMYMMANDAMNFNFASSVTNSISNAYTSARNTYYSSSSSGGGYGGGFSGGGGGGGRRWWLWRQIMSKLSN